MRIATRRPKWLPELELLEDRNAPDNLLLAVDPFCLDLLPLSDVRFAFESGAALALDSSAERYRDKGRVGTRAAGQLSRIAWAHNATFEHIRQVGARPLTRLDESNHEARASMPSIAQVALARHGAIASVSHPRTADFAFMDQHGIIEFGRDFEFSLGAPGTMGLKGSSLAASALRSVSWRPNLAGGAGYWPDEPIEDWAPPANTMPIAGDDATLTPEDIPVTIDVLTNDYDVDEGDRVVLDDLTNEPQHGSVKINGDNTITYTPHTDWPDPASSATDWFSYEISDIYGAVTSATVTITVNAVQDVPVAFHDAFRLSGNNSPDPLLVPIDEPRMLANDIDYDQNDTLTVQSFTQPGIGSLSRDATGALMYTVPPNSGKYMTTFTYLATDGHDPSNTAIVYLFVEPPDYEPCGVGEQCPTPQPPVAVNDTYEFQGDSLDVPAPGVFANDYDPDGDLFITILGQHPAAGKLHSFNLDGSFNYGTSTPYPDADQFTYFAWDSLGLSAGAVVALQKYEPRLEFYGYDNKRYNPERDALNVSNYVTTVGLPKPADTTWETTVTDVDNFRLYVHDTKQQANEVTVNLQVIRGESQKFFRNYVLPNRPGTYAYYGYFLRLVTDGEGVLEDGDDDVPVVDVKVDPDDQTILVQLGDKLKATNVTAGGGTLTRELEVGRPMSQDANKRNNSEKAQWLHDIRELKVRFVVFRNAGGTGPGVSRADVEYDILRANQRLAQSTIRLKVVEIEMGGAGDPGVPRPAPLQDGTFDGNTQSQILALTLDEAALVAAKDGDPNSIDVFYVGPFGPATAAVWGPYAVQYRAARNRTGNANAKNFVVIGPRTAQLRSDEPFVLPHEMMHILLDAPHRRNEPITALLYVRLGLRTAVGGAKRIGPNPEAEVAGVGNTDTSVIRVHAERLP